MYGPCMHAYGIDEIYMVITKGFRKDTDLSSIRPIGTISHERGIPLSKSKKDIMRYKLCGRMSLASSKNEKLSTLYMNEKNPSEIERTT